jgi:hypothetical protein
VAKFPFSIVFIGNSHLWNTTKPSLPITKMVLPDKPKHRNLLLGSDEKIEMVILPFVVMRYSLPNIGGGKL